MTKAIIFFCWVQTTQIYMTIMTVSVEKQFMYCIYWSFLTSEDALAKISMIHKPSSWKIFIISEGNIPYTGAWGLGNFKIKPILGYVWQSLKNYWAAYLVDSILAQQCCLGNLGIWDSRIHMNVCKWLFILQSASALGLHNRLDQEEHVNILNIQRVLISCVF